MENELTTFESKCDILAEFWITYKNTDEYDDFVSYNDLGLPLAYLISMDIVAVTPKAQTFVEETFSVLLSALGMEDEGFQSLDDLIMLQE